MGGAASGGNSYLGFTFFRSINGFLVGQQKIFLLGRIKESERDGHFIRVKGGREGARGWSFFPFPFFSFFLLTTYLF